jgi:iron uptake system EfeUOB component EfeO/EfeM
MESKYAGMTVNERLYVSGMTSAFDKAIEERDFEKVRNILTEVELDEDSIKPILERLGLNA